MREADLSSPQWLQITNFLNDGVKWGMLEERSHTSKSKGDSRRRKYYLHPLLSPYFTIPFTRVKEPLYVNDPEIVNQWIFGSEQIKFSARVGPEKKARDRG
jgi:hypothetical protein